MRRLFIVIAAIIFSILYLKFAFADMPQSAGGGYFDQISLYGQRAITPTGNTAAFYVNKISSTEVTAETFKAKSSGTGTTADISYDSSSGSYVFNHPIEVEGETIEADSGNEGVGVDALRYVTDYTSSGRPVLGNGQSAMYLKSGKVYIAVPYSDASSTFIAHMPVNALTPTFTITGSVTTTYNSTSSSAGVGSDYSGNTIVTELTLTKNAGTAVVNSLQMTNSEAVAKAEQWRINQDITATNITKIGGITAGTTSGLATAEIRNFYKSSNALEKTIANNSFAGNVFPAAPLQYILPPTTGTSYTSAATLPIYALPAGKITPTVSTGVYGWVEPFNFATSAAARVDAITASVLTRTGSIPDYCAWTNYNIGTGITTTQLITRTSNDKSLVSYAAGNDRANQILLGPGTFDTTVYDPQYAVIPASSSLTVEFDAVFYVGGVSSFSAVQILQQSTGFWSDGTYFNGIMFGGIGLLSSTNISLANVDYTTSLTNATTVSAVAMASRSWHHYKIVWTGTNVNVFVDGSAAAAYTTTTAKNISSLGGLSISFYNARSATNAIMKVDNILYAYTPL